MALERRKVVSLNFCYTMIWTIAIKNFISSLQITKIKVKVFSYSDKIYQANIYSVWKDMNIMKILEDVHVSQDAKEKNVKVNFKFSQKSN